MSTNRQRINQAVERVIALFESAELPQTIALNLVQGQGVPMHRWSLLNRIFVWDKGTRDARGIRQWQKAGRTVKPGAEPIQIIAPYQRRHAGEEGAGPGKLDTLSGYGQTAVYRFEDTEGAPLPSLAPPQPPPLLEVARLWGFEVSYGKPQESLIAFCDPEHFDSPHDSTLRGGLIFLGSHDAPIFFHELAHAAHNRLEKLKPDQVWEQECVAELAAMVMASVYGFEWSGNGRAYIEAYASRQHMCARQAVLRVLARVQRVLELVLGTAGKLALTLTLSHGERG